jgi:hypothetical protein
VKNGDRIGWLGTMMSSRQACHEGNGGEVDYLNGMLVLHTTKLGTWDDLDKMH